MKSFIELIYSAAIGIAVALFIGFGIWAAYPGPNMPDYPIVNYSNNGETSSEDRQTQTDYEMQFKSYQEEANVYGQKVAGVAVLAGIAFFIFSTLKIKNNEVLRDGVMIGGIFTSVYALSRSFSIVTYSDVQRNNRIVTFIAACSLLVMVMVFANTKFRSEPTNKKRRK
ncbi:MAG: hypothetical protein M3Q79_03795 [bacterium]|nr:hypothetical protein [bacterium]